MAKRKRQDKEAQDKAAPKRGRRKDSTSALWGHAIFAITVSAAGLAVAALVLWWQLVVGGNERHVDKVGERQLAAYASLFDGRLADLKAMITIAASRAETVDAVMTSNVEAMSRTTGRMRDLFPFAKRVELFQAGAAQIDMNSEVPISFQALAVIRAAEKSGFSGPEISSTDRGVFYVAAPMTQAGRVVGTLFVVFDNNYFYGSLIEFPADTGTLLLNQKFEGAVTTAVMEYGEGGTPAETITAQLDVPHWYLEFRPSGVDPVLNALSLVAPILVIIACMLAGISMAFSRLIRKLQQDAATLSDYLSRLARGRGGAVDTYELPLFQRLAVSAGSFKQNAHQAKVKDDPLDFDYTFEDEDEAPSNAAEAIAKAAYDADADGDDDEPGDNFGIEVSEESPLDLGTDLDPEMFRAYDIRGVVEKNLTPDAVYLIGRAFAAAAKADGQTECVVGGDGRASTETLRESLNRGLNEGGIDVIDIGVVPTPVLYFATHLHNTGTGIMITGSHNPPEYNGLKMLIGGVTLAEGAITDLRTRIENNDLSVGNGSTETIGAIDDYLERILDDVALAQPLKIVVDSGNGVAGLVAPRLLRELGCEVVSLYEEVDGTFPNHHPDPAEPANLDDLITVVADESADLGIAFDGDGDRIGVVTNLGTIIWPDTLLMLFCRDIVGRNPGADIVYDVKCSRHLNNVISELGGRPIMWKTGHSHIKAKIKETGALLGGEFSGHVCIAERWYGFDDAIYTAARLLEILSAEDRTTEEIFAEFPVTVSTPEIKIPTTDAAKFSIIEKLISGDFGNGTATTIDGLRVDYDDGWGLVRASNTSPVLSLRFEADGHAALDRIQDTFQAALTSVDPALSFR